MDSINISDCVCGIINMGSVSDIKTLNNPTIQYGTMFAVTGPFRIPSNMSCDNIDIDARIGDMIVSIKKDDNKEPCNSWKLIKLTPSIERITFPVNDDTEIVAEYESDCIYNKDLNIYLKTKNGEKLIVRVAGDYEDDQKVWVTSYDIFEGKPGVVDHRCIRTDVLD